MATNQNTVDFIIEQMASSGNAIRSRKMFGEYAIYCDDKVIAFVCDNTLFVKIIPTSTRLIENKVEGQAYPGSKPYYVIDEETIENADFMAKLSQAMADELPPPKRKK
ncbi:MAG: TfoX/Sxy family protein [Candidatus Saccharimonadales bacterium]